MSRTAAARTTTRTRTSTAVGLAVAGAGIIATFAYQSAPSSASSLGEPHPPVVHPDVPQPALGSAPSFSQSPRSGGRAATSDVKGAVTVADGALPAGVTVIDDEYPGIANLDPDLLRAIRAAARDAGDSGIEFYVNSGWRSRKYQDQLFRDAVSRYGSKKEAARWVATADTSAHVSGDAIDIGPADAAAWLSAHGASYGLCQIYRNESWHYELRPEAIRGECPAMFADSAHDAGGPP
jgi:zinc D-Ala-D-Ala carboxypeptidase